MRILLPLCAAIALLGCESKTSPVIDTEAPVDAPMSPPSDTPPAAPAPEVTPPPAPSAPSADPRPTPRPVGAETDDGTTVGIAPDGEGPAPIRPRRRVNIDQLEAAILEVSGGIGWTEIRGRNEINLFEELSATLGKPDYAQNTEEELEPTILFQKFLDDAARTVCTRMLAADLAALEDPESEYSPVLLIEAGPTDRIDESPDIIEDNLRELMLRFHGRIVPRGAPILANWTWLYRSTDFVTQDPTQGWLGVCVGLFTHPDFYLF